ncbi:hypothetical protein VOM14_21870 [Paraburkholderia sp. MPAMCS5]|uniref:hypothetical protein n=1 Tax=Paraburkholderia sp. MPAMCS5 TaxID=3112563 RepID=UPI002E1891E3|nr:hypothetical protein [Paraburkholderia sp. MPAMCS5]
MAEPVFTRDARALTQGVYTLRPARRLRFRIAVWALAGALSAAAGAGAVIAGKPYLLRRAGMPLTQCAPASVDQTAGQTELARTRLALQQESAARAAVQKTADSAAAEVARLDGELQFLRGQSKTAPRR